MFKKLTQSCKNRLTKLSFSHVKMDRNTILDLRGNKLEIGSNVYLRSDKRGYHIGMPFPTTVLLDAEGSSCQIGNNTRINGCYIHAKKSIIIGENVVIAAGTNLIDSNGHETYSLNRTIGRDTPQSIIIENNVWIGANCMILKGTQIGNNSIVAANSVVKGTFPDNCIIQGNPAQIVKQNIFDTNENCDTHKT